MPITVGGVIDPAGDIYITPNHTLSIGLWGDGAVEQGQYYLGIQAGDPGSFDIDNVVIPPGSPVVPSLFWDPVPGLNTPIVGLTYLDMTPEDPPYMGQLIDNITFHCEGLGDVTMGLFDGNANLLDTQVVHQVPEPATIALLGLGAMMLRRKR
jgi:hypothetical protein